MKKGHMEKGSIRFFKVDKCGFYKSKNNKDVWVKDGLSSIVDIVREWVLEQSSIENTLPWDREEHTKRVGIYSRCVTKDEATGDSLFVFWKAINNGESRLGGISRSAKVGDDASSDIKIDNTDIIVGQPMYYWFIPEFNVIASVHFPHSLSATNDIAWYVKRCIDNKIYFPHKKISKRESPISSEPIITVTYNDPVDNGAMRFKLVVSSKEIDFDKINPKVLANKVTHVVTRDKSSNSEKTTNGVNPLFSLFNKIREVKVSENIEIIERVDLTEDELIDILEIYKNEVIDKNEDDWVNIGFKEIGSDNTRWLDSYITQSFIKLPQLFKNHAYHNSEKVLDALLHKRDDLTNFLLSHKKDNIVEIQQEISESFIKSEVV